MISKSRELIFKRDLEIAKPEYFIILRKLCGD
jgi:hypothetical protein